MNKKKKEKTGKSRAKENKKKQNQIRRTNIPMITSSLDLNHRNALEASQNLGFTRRTKNEKKLNLERTKIKNQQILKKAENVELNNTFRIFKYIKDINEFLEKNNSLFDLMINNNNNNKNNNNNWSNDEELEEEDEKIRNFFQNIVNKFSEKNVFDLLNEFLNKMIKLNSNLKIEKIEDYIDKFGDLNQFMTNTDFNEIVPQYNNHRMNINLAITDEYYLYNKNIIINFLLFYFNTVSDLINTVFIVLSITAELLQKKEEVVIKKIKSLISQYEGAIVLANKIDKMINIDVKRLKNRIKSNKKSDFVKFSNLFKNFKRKF